MGGPNDIKLCVGVEQKYDDKHIGVIMLAILLHQTRLGIVNTLNLIQIHLIISSQAFPS